MIGESTESKLVSTAGRLANALDRLQRRRRPVAFCWAVVKKYGEDEAGQLAALTAYYGFFSMLPLLMAGVTILGMVIANRADLRQHLLDSALHDVPLLGPQIARNVHALDGGGVLLGVAVLLAIWSGLGVLRSFEAAMNAVWNVPRRRRPNALQSSFRALVLLVVLGIVVLASTVLAAFTGGASAPIALLAAAGSFLLNLVLYLAAFRLLPSRDITWRDVLPGALLGATVWTILCALGGAYIAHQLQGASQVYGTFAGVIVLLAWIYLGAQVTLYAAEINVVLRDRLWPRSLVGPLTDADRRALKRYPHQEERRDDMNVEVSIAGSGD